MSVGEVIAIIGEEGEESEKQVTTNDESDEVVEKSISNEKDESITNVHVQENNLTIEKVIVLFAIS